MKKFIIPIAAVLLLTACEKQIDIDIEEQEPLVVMHSFATPDNPLYVDLTMSRPVFGWHSSNEGYINSPFPPVENATVTLVVEGAGNYTATRDSNRYTFHYTPQSGDRMQLRVDVPGHETLTASTTMPQPPSLGQVSYEVAEDNYGEQYLIIHVPLNDPAGEENYYSFQINITTYYYPQFDAEGNLVNYESVSTETRWINCNDQFVVENNVSDIFMDDPGSMPEFLGNTLFFTDRLLNGISHTIDLKTNYLQVNNNNLYIVAELVATSYSREEYYFHATEKQLNDVDEIISIFSEPSTAYSNVNGGAGAFGAHCTQVIEFLRN